MKINSSHSLGVHVMSAVRAVPSPHMAQFYRPGGDGTGKPSFWVGRASVPPFHARPPGTGSAGAGPWLRDLG